jgi:2-methylisocitrate lyase-like PEP mutase family enzyme
MVINARTDVFLFEIGAPAQRMDEVLSRAAAYAGAGSDCLFVPGLVDLDRLKSLAASSLLPINAMAGPGAPTVDELGAAGVRRISLGTALAQAAYTTAQRAARELLTSGTYGMMEGAIGFGELNGMFRG